MTKLELKQIMGMLDAIGVPDSAQVLVGSAAVNAAAFSLLGEPSDYSLDSGGHWAAGAGNPAAATAVSLKLV